VHPCKAIKPSHGKLALVEMRCVQGFSPSLLAHEPA
jgi:hypothetical protein